MEEQNDIISDLTLITEIAADLSGQFNNVNTTNLKKAKSTQYLAKAINTNFSILSLIPGSVYHGKHGDYLDSSSIYALLRNQMEISNIFWHLIEDSQDEKLFQFKIELQEYHDTLSAKKIYHALFGSEESEAYYVNRANQQLATLQTSPIYQSLHNSKKTQIEKGNISTLETQFEIVTKRDIQLERFKAFYKLFSTHTHSSPTAIKNLTNANMTDTKEFEAIFFLLSISYTLSFLSEMICSVAKIWNIKFKNAGAQQILEFYASQLSTP